MRPNDVLTRMRAVLSSRTTREAMIFAFFVVLSATAGFMQVLHDNYNIDIPVPLVLTNVPKGVVITDTLPPELIVKVNDRGSTVLSHYLTTDPPPVAISFDDYNTSVPVGTVHIATSQLVKKLQSYLPPNSSVQRIIGDTISFSYNRGVSRRLPVVVCGVIESTHHTYVHSIRTTPDSVTVYAPMAVLDTMTHAPTLPLTLRGLNSDLTVHAQMASSRGVRCVPEVVRTDIHIDSYTEKTVEVPITGINFPADKQLRTFPTKVSVKFRVGMANYNAVTADMFAITVSYEELLRTNHCRLRLKTLPLGVSNATLSKTEVDFLIEQIN